MIGAFIVARMGSTRLPGKTLMPILGFPMIEHLIRRVQASKKIDKIIVATSDDFSDDPLETFAQELGVGCFRGSLENVMDRVTEAAKHFECDTIVELLGDNPLIHADLIDAVIDFYETGQYDYAANVTKEFPVSGKETRLFSVGVRVQVYSLDAAKQWPDFPDYICAPDKSTTAFIFENPEKFKVGYFPAEGKWDFMNKPDLTFAVNYQKNFDMVTRFYQSQFEKDQNFSLKKVYEQLEADKNLLTLMGNE